MTVNFFLINNPLRLILQKNVYKLKQKLGQRHLGKFELYANAIKDYQILRTVINDKY